MRSRWLKLFSALAGLSTFSAVRAEIVINEIHYNPDVKTEPAEFIELYNPGPDAADLTGWRFSSGVHYSFPAGTTMVPGAYLVVAQDPAFLKNKFNAAALGPWTGSLARDGEKITLTDGEGATRDEVDYQLGFPWPTVDACNTSADRTPGTFAVRSDASCAPPVAGRSPSSRTRELFPSPSACSSTPAVAKRIVCLPNKKPPPAS